MAGPSGSGKTTIAHALVERLADRDAQLLPLDAYYRDLSQMSPERRTEVNFDVPGALDAELLIEHVCQLAAGKPIDTPVYDFATHCRTTARRRIRPGEVIVVEGLFALYWQQLRNAFDLSIFVAAPDDICLRRRLARDVYGRGRTEQSVVGQYEATVRPAAEAYVLPTRRHADLVIDGTAPVEESIARIISDNRPPTRKRPRSIRRSASNRGAREGCRPVRGDDTRN
jgi:uridine kinase